MPPTHSLAALPYRGRFGAARPAALHELPLPPGVLPARQGLRPLKAWRYVGVYGAELMICLASVRVGPARQSFWAIWDRAAGRRHERTAVGTGAVRMSPGRAQGRGPQVQIDLALAESAGEETICQTGDSYAWTRKQGGIPAEGTVTIDGTPRPVRGRAIIDDTAGYYARHTAWRWCAGIGLAADGREVAWNLVAGVNDPPRGSERTVWIDGQAREVAAVAFAPDLSGVRSVPADSGLDAVPGLGFSAESVLERRQNLGLVRSRYRQPFGHFSGELLAGVGLREAFGVMEDHDAWW